MLSSGEIIDIYKPKKTDKQSKTFQLFNNFLYNYMTVGFRYQLYLY